MICVDLERNKLTFSEAWRNFKEMHTVLDVDHKPEVQQLLIDKLVEERKRKNDENNKIKA